MAWGLAVVALAEVVVVEAAALQIEGDRCWGPLWPRVHQDLQYRYKKPTNLYSLAYPACKVTFAVNFSSEYFLFRRVLSSIRRRV